MRSERDIKRTPRRPLAEREAGTGPDPRPAAAEATAPAAPTRDIPVSYAPRSEPRGPASRGEFRRDDPRDRPRRDDAPRGDDRGRPAGPMRGPSASPGRPPAGRPDDRGRSTDSRPPEGRYQDDRPRVDQRRRVEERPRPDDRRFAADDRGLHRDAGPARPNGPAFTPAPAARRGPDRPPQDHRPQRSDRPPQPAADAPSRVPASPVVRKAAPEEGMRLSKVLGDRGLASRREADDWIAAGWVTVDGQMAVLGQRVLPNARIEVDPAAHTQQAKSVTILLNKPIGYVSGQAEDGYEPASVLITAANHWPEDPSRKPFHPGHARGLAPAGRLDIDSTGLLVLTQDGRVAKHLIGEDSDVEKEYLVRVQPVEPGPVPEDCVQRLSHGLELDGKKLKPAKVSWANEDQLRFVLREGRKRQIRRMCELVGLKAVGLKRVRIGSVVLGKLPAGQWRYLREDERF